MTRETKIGLVVACSFLCLVGVVIASKINGGETLLPKEPEPQEANVVAAAAPPGAPGKSRPPGENRQVNPPMQPPTRNAAPQPGATPIGPVTNMIPPGMKAPEPTATPSVESLLQQKKQEAEKQATVEPKFVFNATPPSVGTDLKLPPQPAGTPALNAQPGDNTPKLGVPPPAPNGFGSADPLQVAQGPQPKQQAPIPFGTQGPGPSPASPIPAPPPIVSGPPGPVVPLPMPGPVMGDGQAATQPKEKKSPDPAPAGSPPPSGFNPPVLPPLVPAPTAPPADLTPPAPAPALPTTGFNPPSQTPGLPPAGFNPPSQTPGLPPAGFNPPSQTPALPTTGFNPPSQTPALPTTGFNPPSQTPALPPAGFNPTGPSLVPLPSPMNTSPTQPFTNVPPGPNPVIGPRQQASTPTIQVAPQAYTPQNPIVPSFQPAGGKLPMAQVNRIDPDVVSVLPKETNFAQLSTRLYGNAKYAGALQAFNKEHWQALPDGQALAANQPLLNPGQQVLHPPVNELERTYPDLIRVPAPSIGTPPPIAVMPPARAIPVVPSAAPVTTTPAGAREYVVQAGGGERIRDIAQRLLGNAERWTEIYERNQGLQPQFAIPQGTRIMLP